jgi:uncharacterized membrane protein YgcG
LVDPAQKTALTLSGTELTEPDKKVLRVLGERLAAIAALPVQSEKIAGWRAINGLRQFKPMINIWTDQIPWHEMDVDGELKLRTTGEWSRFHEWEMRKLIYQWEHMPVDMVIEPAVYSPLAVGNTAFGITENVDLALTDEANSVVSRHFNIQIRDEDDLEKIKVPVVTHDNARSEGQYQQLREIMEGPSRSGSSAPTGSCSGSRPGTSSSGGGGSRRLWSISTTAPSSSIKRSTNSSTPTRACLTSSSNKTC